MNWFRRRYVKGAEWLLTYMLIFLTQTEQPIGTTAFIFKPTKLWLRTIKKIDTRGCYDVNGKLSSPDSRVTFKEKT